MTFSQTASPELSDALDAVARHRDKRAFATLFRHFAPKIKRFGLKQFGSEALALELVQDTMTSVWRKAHLYQRDKGAATTWVYTVMRNASFDTLRKMKTHKEEHLSDELWPIIEQEHAAHFDANDHLQDNRVKRFIERLPAAQREVLWGVYFQDLTQEQLAEHLNLPLGTVKSRLRLALEKLRQALEADHD
ncbi:sigma-70 family RNA polymerase sigma factor [Pseudoalteromonas fenneropenaei]|uniref:Sigma-70 family RNA polymerase sigma factor n=1 Tax=Pseudoalteromonas fenneropenaei TaxID=1737459 RepID=A0ABV7CMA7_9GAMM